MNCADFKIFYFVTVFLVMQRAIHIASCLWVQWYDNIWSLKEIFNQHIEY